MAQSYQTSLCLLSETSVNTALCCQTHKNLTSFSSTYRAGFHFLHTRHFYISNNQYKGTKLVTCCTPHVPMVLVLLCSNVLTQQSDVRFLNRCRTERQTSTGLFIKPSSHIPAWRGECIPLYIMPHSFLQNLECTGFLMCRNPEPQEKNKLNVTIVIYGRSLQCKSWDQQCCVCIFNQYLDIFST